MSTTLDKRTHGERHIYSLFSIVPDADRGFWSLNERPTGVGRRSVETDKERRDAGPLASLPGIDQKHELRPNAHHACVSLLYIYTKYARTISKNISSDACVLINHIF